MTMRSSAISAQSRAVLAVLVVFALLVANEVLHFLVHRLTHSRLSAVFVVFLTVTGVVLLNFYSNEPSYVPFNRRS